MNPLVLLALGGVALMALRKKPKAENGGRPNGGVVGDDCDSWGPVYHNGAVAGSWVDDGLGGCILNCREGYVLGPNGDTCVPAEQADYIVEEGIIDSAGGVDYAYRIWRMYSVAMPYVGEILLDDVWTSGPMGQSQDEVGDALQVMVDSLDEPETGFDVHPATDPCDGGLPGPFNAMVYDENMGGWVGIVEDLVPGQYPMEAGRDWCVVEIQPGLYEGRVVDAQTRQVIFKGSDSDPHIAASMAAFAVLQPGGPFPWPPQVGFHGVENP